MSVEALSWAINAERTGPLDPATRAVLVTLANFTGGEGEHAYPAVETIARRSNMHPRSVKRHLAKLRELGLIRPGDQRFTAHLRGDRRPIVYDLVITHRVSTPVDTHPIGGDSPVTPSDNSPVDNPSRGDSEGTHGVTPVSPKPRTKPNYETTPTPSRLPLVECPACGDTFRDSHECRPHRRHRRPSALTQPEAPARHPLAHRWCGEHYTTRNAAGICAGCRADQIGVPTS